MIKAIKKLLYPTVKINDERMIKAFHIYIASGNAEKIVEYGPSIFEKMFYVKNSFWAIAIGVAAGYFIGVATNTTGYLWMAIVASLFFIGLSRYSMECLIKYSHLKGFVKMAELNEEAVEGKRLNFHEVLIKKQAEDGERKSYEYFEMKIREFEKGQAKLHEIMLNI